MRISECVEGAVRQQGLLEKMFWETKMMVEPKANTEPGKLARRSGEQASMTPKVRGTRER